MSGSTGASRGDCDAATRALLTAFEAVRVKEPAELVGAVALARAAALLQLTEQLQAVTARALRDVTARELFALAEAGSTRSWLRSQACGQGSHASRASLLGRFPVVEQALSDGTISAATATTVAGQLARLPDEVPEHQLTGVLAHGVPELLSAWTGGLVLDDLVTEELLTRREHLAEVLTAAAEDRCSAPAARLEPVFVLLGQTVTPAHLPGALQTLVDALLPEVLDEQARDELDECYLRLRRALRGGWDLDGHLDDATGQALADQLDATLRRLRRSGPPGAAGSGPSSEVVGDAGQDPDGDREWELDAAASSCGEPDASQDEDEGLLPFVAGSSEVEPWADEPRAGDPSAIGSSEVESSEVEPSSSEPSVADPAAAGLPAGPHAPTESPSGFPASPPGPPAPGAGPPRPAVGAPDAAPAPPPEPAPHPEHDGESGRPLRSSRQERYDALVALLADAAAGAAEVPNSPRPALLLITTSLDSLRGVPGALPGTLATAGRPVPLATDTVRRLGCDSTLTAVLVDALGNPVGASGEHRHATRRERRALRAQWGATCAVLGCDCTQTVPHHGEPWWLTGRTRLRDLVPVCLLHHRDLHEGLRVLRLRDGRLIGPTGWVPTKVEAA